MFALKARFILAAAAALFLASHASANTEAQCEAIKCDVGGANCSAASVCSGYQAACRFGSTCSVDSCSSTTCKVDADCKASKICGLDTFTGGCVNDKCSTYASCRSYSCTASSDCAKFPKCAESTSGFKCENAKCKEDSCSDYTCTTVADCKKQTACTGGTGAAPDSDLIIGCDRSIFSNAGDPKTCGSQSKQAWDDLCKAVYGSDYEATDDGNGCQHKDAGAIAAFIIIVIICCCCCCCAGAGFFFYSQGKSNNNNQQNTGQGGQWQGQGGAPPGAV